ncbi:hypothetical protein SS05631_b55320 (plasmid) [Sinorhizobium sp. CCBAU 05631]|nr:hypothetical protein SS05631_b55320 [Sinorhizobium sp. CCBAU 05631]
MDIAFHEVGKAIYLRSNLLCATCLPRRFGAEGRVISA